MTAENEPLEGLVVKLSELAWKQQKIEDESRALKSRMRNQLSQEACDNPDPPEFVLPTYSFEFLTIFEPEPEFRSWSGRLLDSERYIICEIFNNGDGVGNYYIWYREEAKWGIEAEAKREFPEIGVGSGEQDSRAKTPPLDAWLARVMSKTENSWE